MPDDGSTQALSLGLEGVSNGMINVDVRFVPVGKVLDIKALAARSASTHRLKVLDANTTAKHLIKSRSDAAAAEKRMNGGGHQPGGCFGGCFTPKPPKSRMLEFDSVHAPRVVLES